jgi:hypothetical protein
MDDIDLPTGLAGARMPLAGAVLLVAFAVLGAGPPGATLVSRGIERAAALLLSFERWVLDSLVAAAATLLSALAWVAAASDAEALDTPVTAVAVRTERLAGALRPLVGGSLERVAWWLIASLGVAGIAHAAWPGR